MRFFKKIFRFFIFSNLFIAVCTAVMVYHAKYFIQANVDFFSLQLLLFFATLTSYSFHWYLTQAEQGNISIRIVWLLQYRKIYLYFFYTGFIGAAILLFPFVKYWQWFLPAMLLTFLYSAPKLPFPFFKSIGKFIVAKTLLLSITWTYVTTVLPFVVYGGEWETDYMLFILYRFTLITAICILFDVRDKDYDVEAGIQNMVTWFPLKTVKRIFWITIILNLVSIGAIIFYNAGWISICSMFIPVIILIALYKTALNTNNDYLFYFVLDGLMALSSVLTLLFQNGLGL